MQLIEFDTRHQADLVAKTQAGDRRAFGRIYDETFPQIYRYALALTHNREDAEDLTAETYERALRRIHSYESRDIPISIWLLRIARNVGHERSQRSMRESTVTVSEEQLDQIAANPDSLEAGLLLDGFLRELTPAQRDVLALRLAGLRCREIAQALGKAEGTIKALQFAAIRNLRRTAHT